LEIYVKYFVVYFLRFVVYNAHKKPFISVLVKTDINAC